MREIETAIGTIIVRSLTRKEIRAGQDQFGMRYLSPGDQEKLFDLYEDYRDYVLGCLFDEEEIDQFSNAEQTVLLNAIMRETWSDPGEEKNLNGSGGNDQTPTETEPAADAVN